MHKALFSQTYKNDIVKCTLCPHDCYIQPDKSGACAIRKNVKGTLFTLIYGKCIARAIDPIEKKPLYHFYPGSSIYSYATAGCNFTCSFCQNWDISQISKGINGQVMGKDMAPKAIVKDALQNGCKNIAMTYNEPSIQFEYALDVCKEAKKKGLKTVFISNGYISKDAIDMIAPYLDAINIDLKSFSDEYYKKVCGARLQPVLDAIKHYHKKGVWLELTTLIIPSENDSDQELQKITHFIADIDIHIPWHISRFHPDYKMLDKEVTPLSTLQKAYTHGKKAGLKYIYLGNVDHDISTYCPQCNAIIIDRNGHVVTQINIKENLCLKCGSTIPGKFS